MVVNTCNKLNCENRLPFYFSLQRKTNHVMEFKTTYTILTKSFYYVM